MYTYEFVLKSMCIYTLILCHEITNKYSISINKQSKFQTVLGMSVAEYDVFKQKMNDF